MAVCRVRPPLASTRSAGTNLLHAHAPIPHPVTAAWLQDSQASALHFAQQPRVDTTQHLARADAAQPIPLQLAQASALYFAQRPLVSGNSQTPLVSGKSQRPLVSGHNVTNVTNITNTRIRGGTQRPRTDASEPRPMQLSALAPAAAAASCSATANCIPGKYTPRRASPLEAMCVRAPPQFAVSSSRRSDNVLRRASFACDTRMRRVSVRGDAHSLSVALSSLEGRMQLGEQFDMDC